MPKNRPRDKLSDTWETWRKVLAVLAMLSCIPMRLWIGLPLGFAAILSVGAVVYVWKPLFAAGDPKLGTYMYGTGVYKIAAFVTRAKAVYVQYWEAWKKSKLGFLSMFGTAVGGGMPFPDQWHMTADERRAFEESEASTPASIKDYSSSMSWKSLVPKRLSTIWSAIFALIVAGLEYPLSMVTDMTVSWGFSLPFALSYPISVVFLFFLAQYYNITRLTQGDWGAEQALVPAPALMLNRMEWKKHWKPGVFTSSIIALITLVLAASFVVGVGVPPLYAALFVFTVTTLSAAVVVSFRAKKPWREPWAQYIAESQQNARAFEKIFGADRIPQFVSSSQYPVENEMENIQAQWREMRDAGELTDDEAEQAPSTIQRLNVMLYNGTGLKPNDLLGIEDDYAAHTGVFNPAFIFPERTGEDGEPMTGTVINDGFQILYTTEPKEFSLSELMSRKYPAWEEELCLHNTVLRDVREFFGTNVQLVSNDWITAEDSPSQILEVICHPINDRFERAEFESFANSIESTREINWLRVRLNESYENDRSTITILLSDNPHDEKNKYERNAFTAKSIINDADWTHIFRKSGLVSSDGTLPKLSFSKKSTELVTSTAFMLPTELSREDTRGMEEEFKKFSGSEFIEIKGGWDNSRRSSKAAKERAKSPKAFSILSAPKDPLDQTFLFGDYADITLRGRKPSMEQIDWVAGINSADQPATDSFIKGDAPHLLLAGESGSGKPLHPDTLVWTHRGLVKIKDLTTGEPILSHDGKWTRVKNVFASRHEPSTFEVFVDGVEAEPAVAAGRHLWSTRAVVSRLGDEPLTYAGYDSGIANYSALDDIEPMSGQALDMIRPQDAESLAGTPINVKGLLPVGLNFRYPQGVGEDSPEANNSRSVHAMRGIPPHIAAILTVFSKNEIPDGHIIVNNADATRILFSTAGYDLEEIDVLDSGESHMWCAGLQPLLNQIDFENTIYPLFSTSMSGADIMPNSVDKAVLLAECASALINCTVPRGHSVESDGDLIFGSSIVNGGDQAEIVARLALTAFGMNTKNSKSPVTITANGELRIAARAIASARNHVGYPQLRKYILGQHAAALGALSMLPRVSRNLFVLTHSELVYFLLMCGLSVNTHEHNDGLLFVESSDLLDRRIAFMPLRDKINNHLFAPTELEISSTEDDTSDYVDNEMNYLHVLAGMVSASAQILVENVPGNRKDGRTLVHAYCSAKHAALMIDIAQRCVAADDRLDDDVQLIVPDKTCPGRYMVHPDLYDFIGHSLPGNLNPAIGDDGALVAFRSDGSIETLVDRHAIVKKTGMSYQDVALLLLGIQPDSSTRVAYDVISSTGRTQTTLVHGSRELYSSSRVAELLHEAQRCRGERREVVVEPVVTTFTLGQYADTLTLPRLVNSDNEVPRPTYSDTDTADDITTEYVSVEVESVDEECEMMCISVEDSSHTFMLADNGLMTHNSVFVQSMLTQLCYNNGPDEMLAWLNDPKIGLQRMMNLDNCERFVDPWTPNDEFFANTADLYQEGVDRMANERNALLAKSPDPETGIPPEKLGEARETARQESEANGTDPLNHPMMFPYIFMVQEECATVFSDAGSKEDAAHQSDVLRCAGRIAREGRSAGVYEVCMTQYPTNASIPSQIRNQMRRVGLKCRNAFASNIIIDEDGLEQLYLPGSAMTRDDNGEYRRSRGFMLRNGKPSRGEENDLMEVLGSLPKNNTFSAGLTTSAASGNQQVLLGDFSVDIEMLYDDITVNRATVQTPGYDFEQRNHVPDEGKNPAEATGIGASVVSGKKTKDYTDQDLNRDMKKKHESNSAPWLKTDEDGKPISSAEYKKRSEKPSIPKSSGRRGSGGRRSRL